MGDALQKGRDFLADLNPDLEALLADRYDALVPEMSETLVEWAYGRHYARGGVDLKTRQLCTLAALTALGSSEPQLKINIANTLAAGASETEIAEVIWQMALYAGMPRAINGLNAAKEVFAAG